ncbi:MipA/OmpV family protein [Methylobacterium longum]|uniref:MipA/OmpV family protein n=1 Tax=Methylobacterium longum TaxID=767694 RepID=A0ABT8ALW0_9HYPH|nr:MipA/OmpV family protein [Methylobacterium longum]MDN3570268.1 MipA/OmpV family protein [Methylobacterium longum]
MKPLSHPAQRFCALLGAGALLAAFGMTAPRAADLGAVLPRPVPTFAQVDPSTWVVTVSGSLQVVPRYPGASDYTAVGYPSIDIRRLGEPRRFSAPDDGFSLSLYDDPVFRIGPTARIVPGRYYGDDRRHLFGFRDARFAIEPGVFAEFYPVSFIRTRVEARQGIYGHHGTVGSVAADYLIPTEKLLFSIGPRFNIGDASFARKYFGVSPAEAALNGRATPYDPRSFYSAGVLGAVTYTQNETWAYTAFAGYTRILGASGDSPLVRRPFGSPDQFQFGIKIDYSFTTPALF